MDEDLIVVVVRGQTRPYHATLSTTGEDRPNGIEVQMTRDEWRDYEDVARRYDDWQSMLRYRVNATYAD